FGIARAKNSHLTTDNSVLGTAHYVSPEQTQGKELGPTTDIYSLGIVMYEAATGRVPFDGDDAISVALKQVNEQPVPPTAVNPAVDSALESIILKCMQKDPKDRFQTADELYHVLRDYLAGRLAAVNNATEVLPANPVVPAIAPIAASSTQSLPRIDTAEHIKPQTATQKAQQEADAAMKKHKRRVVLFSILGVIALIAAIVGVYTLVNPSNQKREVPNYLSMTEADALKAIDESEFFKKGSVKEQYSSTVEKGVVMDQDPDSGRMVAKGTKINLVISKGKEPAATVKVPNLTGMSPSQADKALAKVGLVGQAGDSVYDENVSVGMVAKQSPAGGSEAKAGDTITYQLSKGKESVDVPSVVGQDADSATSVLKGAGFEVNVSYGNSDTVQKGYVYDQSPTGSADKGTTVTIYVSNGPKTVSVPNVVGSTADDAKGALEAEGFKYNLTYQYSSSVAQGTVVSQSATSAKSGATITLVISNGPDPATSGANTNTDSTTTNNGTTSTTTKPTGGQ
ncbi:MAG: PASTA domain-containing protein, partial [Parafannyhessea umbonata]